YWVAEDDQAATTEQLQQYLQKSLPAYMVPAIFIQLEALPLTANGKIDYRALPKIDALSLSDSYLAPSNEIEAILAEIWATVLKIARVGVNDNFFARGGHSLLATQVISRIRTRFHCQLTVRILFECPTIAQLAKVIQAQSLSAAYTPIEPIEREGLLPLSFAQQRLWFIDRYQGGQSTIYNMPLQVRLHGKLNIKALETAFNHLLARHEILRTTFIEQAGIPYQVIAPQCIIKLAPKICKAQALTNLLQQEALKPFDLAQGPLIRIQLFQISEQDHALSLTQHHIISDGWSMGILWREMIFSYCAACADQPIVLPGLSIQYADFAHWQRQQQSSEHYQKQLHYWKQQLSDVEPLQLPTDKPRPTMMSHRGGVYRFTLDEVNTSGLYQIAQKQNTSIYTVLLAALNILLSRYTGQTDICVGSAIANRNYEAIESLIGFFVNTLVMRNQVSVQQPFLQFLEQVTQTALDAYTHQDIPFEQLVEELKVERDTSRSPLFQVMLVLQNISYDVDLDSTGLEGELVATEQQTSKFDLNFSVQENAGKLYISIGYCLDLFYPGTIARMAQHFKVLLQGIVQSADRLIEQLPIMSEAERHQLTVAWNQTQANYPRDKTIPQLFAQQVAKTPDEIALIFEGKHLTYRQLDARSNQLAHYLQALGVVPDTLVGLALERSLEMIVALFAILKAGGAYVPLEPEYPKERLAFILSEMPGCILVTQSKFLQHFPVTSVKTLCLDKDKKRMSQYSKQPVATHLTSEQLAYVIYTSGSTGRPKGVMISHSNVINYIEWIVCGVFTQSYQSYDCSASIAFDATVTVSLLPLLQGDTVVMCRQDVKRDVTLFVEHLVQHKIEFVKLTPSYLSALIVHLENNGYEQLKFIKCLMVGGEAVQAKAVEKWTNHFPQCYVIAHYGPTETTVGVSTYIVSKQACHQAQNIPIGTPGFNSKFYILDNNQNIVPIGAIGELHIGGESLARGYLNQAELTQKKFIVDPFSHPIKQHNGKQPRMYKTGDLARYLPDGNIEYIGRSDDQVKIRGFRVELGEIEAKLTEHDGVQAGVVVLCKGESGEKRLVAYWVAVQGKTTDVAKLRTHLQQCLPDYMIPTIFIQLESIPLTPNGKVDRKSLPDVDKKAISQDYVAPRYEIEAILAEIWATVLKIARVGVNDNFFAR
ncbi:MAG: amino acid adenylation domain-containing protein, partial [Gammaproteobacteria bacterium]